MWLLRIAYARIPHYSKQKIAIKETKITTMERQRLTKNIHREIVSKIYIYIYIYIYKYIYIYILDNTHLQRYQDKTN